MISRFLSFLSKPSATLAAGVLLLVGAIGALFIFGGASTAMNMTSSTEFCISCHEMENNAWAEYKETIHYQNSRGLQTQCADCHIPHDIVGKLTRKVEALREVYGHFTGVIDTPEKYDAHRLAMAEKVWGEMRANDSANCRTCHSDLENTLDLQYQWARTNHQRMLTEGKTCIDCHKGIAHKLPNTQLMQKPIPPHPTGR